MIGMATMRTKSCVRDIDGISGEATEPEKIRGHRDELEQQPGAESSTCANHKRHSGEHQHSPVGAMIGKLMSFGRTRLRQGHSLAFVRNGMALISHCDDRKSTRLNSSNYCASRM